ncbi:YitT family protein [Paenibacillus sp. BSR1-1]|uniref:YitT family protein n=1 Tax=Paenibacillus sp. BSR1-1 TaxID=3020845 RepID=UPI0025AEEE2D|nr:YitT family protein [Paenibacillus sp. BSR1-1]MDN3018815.1 YitT family protein [Paenibacillus sp. BSR1-1]
MFEKIFAMMIGSILLSLGVNGFLVPYHLLDGGVIGLGLIIHYFYGWPTGLSIIILSLPLYVLAWFFERRYFFYSLHGLIISSFCIDLFSFINGRINLGILPSTVIGGLLVGIGIGVMLRYETSTGGTDLLAQLLTKFTSINIGIIIFIIDGLIITSGIQVVGLEKFFYSLLTIICVGLMTTVTVARRPETH